MQKRASPLLLILSICIVASAHSGEIYKWVDKNGKVHFGDRPDLNQPHQEMELKPLNTVGSGDASRKTTQQRMINRYQKRREEQENQRRQERQQRADNQRKCRQYKKQLKEYRTASSLYLEGAKGERKYFDSKDRDKLYAQLQRRIKDTCR